MGAQRELLPWQSHLWETALCPDQGWENSGEPYELETWLTSGGAPLMVYPWEASPGLS